ncbi:MAG: DUF5615 family PIN-like protein [Actinomycetia bacterium]|nr:DUF5615 family PIN-like protein [Actinomycetes bacterium]
MWDWAGERGFTIVSKDSDFRDLAASLVPPPKAIWLRVGNASTTEIQWALHANTELMLKFETERQEALLVID